MRLPTVLLWSLALAFPLGALLQPWACPARSQMPVVKRQLISPVILLTVAGLRADRVHHLGYAGETTPNLDRLAEQGVTFPLAWANSNDEVTTTACLMSGLCPGATGVRGPEGVLGEGVVTLAERFAQDGYKTAAYVGNPALDGRGLQQGFDIFESQPGATADELFDGALALLARFPVTNYFLWIDLGELLDPADEDAALMALDAAIGRFLEGLAPQGRLEQLTLCVAGTRGDERADLSEASIHVPILLRLPGQASRGLPALRLAHTVDLHPTLYQFGTRKAVEGLAGRSLDLVVKLQHQVNEQVFAEGRVLWEGSDEPTEAIAVRSLHTKLITDPQGVRRAVYLLDRDPLEQQALKDPVPKLEQLVLRARAWANDCGLQGR